jgi:hypothetical protein
MMQQEPGTIAAGYYRSADWWDSLEAAKERLLGYHSQRNEKMKSG